LKRLENLEDFVVILRFDPGPLSATLNCQFTPTSSHRMVMIPGFVIYLTALPIKFANNLLNTNGITEMTGSVDAMMTEYLAAGQ
jgi:hypothetical protein